MAKVLGAKALIETLKSEGVKHIFGLPGTAIMDIYDACYGDSELELITVRHEQGAGHMADGYARASGQLGVCLLSRGPGASNALIAIENAYHESSPVLALAGIPGTDIHAYDAFEEMDLVSAFKPVTKWAFQMSNGNRIAEFTRMAVHKATQGRPRPVFLAIPEDYQNRDMDFTQTSFNNYGQLYPPTAPREALIEVLKSIQSASFPLIIAGGGFSKASNEGSLVRLAETLNIPVVTSWLRDNLLPTEHFLYVGPTGPGIWPATRMAMEEADLIISIGCRFSEFTTNRFRIFKSDKKIIQVDIDPAEIGKIYEVALGINSDAGLFVRDLLTLVNESNFRPKELGNRQKELLAAYQSERKLPEVSDHTNVHPAELINTLNQIQDEKTLFVYDSGNFAMWLSKYLSFKHSGQLIAPAGGALGFGFPAAIGAQIARPDRRVICLTGDGGFIMTMQEMETAVRYKIPVVTVVFNNNCYANVKVKQISTYQGRVIGADFSNPDFAEFARICGAYGETVSNAEDLKPALERCLLQDRPSLLNVILDPVTLSPPGTTFFTSKGIMPTA